MYDYLVVGAGLTGAIITKVLISKGKTVKVIDKRNHIGGNLYCENNNGIVIHKYGPHIFHTSNKNVWNFVNSIVDFIPFINTPIANYNGKLYNLPFNMFTFYQLWGVINEEQAKEKIKSQIVVNSNPKNLEEYCLSIVGKDIYNILIKGYTEKQWGRDCNKLDKDIIKRLPLRYTFDNSYFNDIYQGIPIFGYNNFIEKLLIGADIELNCDFFDITDVYNIANKVIYTGPIDKYFNYCFGKLEYRSIKFDFKELNMQNYQSTPIINFTDKNVPYTRCIEYKHFDKSFIYTLNDLEKTIVCFEYPIEYTIGETLEPLYPILDNRNIELYNRYYELSKNEKNTIFVGRLAEYKYYDMDDIIEKILFTNFIENFN